jgi:hypothetical protein
MEKRIRSPNYPALSLPVAVGKVQEIYRNLHNHAAPREVAAKAMGYAGLNGASATTISALRKYGLVDRSGEDIKVSERALRILHPHSPAEKSEAIFEAAHSPELFRELAEKFPDKMPNEDLLRNYLVRKGFASAALSSVISAYRETSEMVEHENAGYDSVVVHSEEAPNMLPSPSPLATAQPIPGAPKLTSFQNDERSIGRYDFEGGAFVRIAASPGLDTETALDMVQTLIELKRKELARKSKALNVIPGVDNSETENLENEK